MRTDVSEFCSHTDLCYYNHDKENDTKKHTRNFWAYYSYQYGNK